MMINQDELLYNIIVSLLCATVLTLIVFMGIKMSAENTRDKATELYLKSLPYVVVGVLVSFVICILLCFVVGWRRCISYLIGLAFFVALWMFLFIVLLAMY